MKLFLSRTLYNVATTGMDPDELRRFDQVFVVYPDKVVPELVVDQNRIAARYDELLLEQHRSQATPPAPPGPAARRPAVYEWADYDLPGLDQAGWPCRSEWADIDALADELNAEASTARRYFLNQVVVGRPGITTTATIATNWLEAAAEPLNLEQLLDFIRAWSRHTPPPPRRLNVGAIAQQVFAAAARRSSTDIGWPKDVHSSAAALARLTGIPIVPDPDLPANAWQLVDQRTGEVLYEGTAGPDLTEYIEAIRDDIDKVADEAGLPRDLFH